MGASVKRIAYQHLSDENEIIPGTIYLSEKYKNVCYNYSFYLRVENYNAVLLILDN